MNVLGCGSESKSSDAALVIWHAYEEGGTEQRFLKSSVERYKSLKPDIPVRLVSVPFEPLRTRSESLCHGEMVQISSCLPMTNLVIGHRSVWLNRWESGWSSTWLEELEPSALRALSYRNELYGIPLVAKTLALFYHRDLVERPAQTTAALQAQIKTLQKVHPDVIGLAYDVDDLFFHAPWLLGFGGR